MHCADQGGDTAIFTQLLTIGRRNLSVTDKHGKTFLDHVCMSGSAQRLAEYYKVEYNLKDVSMSTWSPLHWACRTGSYEILKLLNDTGVQASIVETSEPPAKWTPMDIAAYFNNHQLVSSHGKLKKTHD